MPLLFFSCIYENMFREREMVKEPGTGNVPVADNGNYKPLPGQLPKLNDRVFQYEKQTKPARKLSKVELQIEPVDKHNFEKLRIINYLTLPVVYGDDYYEKITSEDLKRYSKVAYLKDVMVGGISCQEKTFEG